jgi:PAS domain S-box-containing protein
MGSANRDSGDDDVLSRLARIPRDEISEDAFTSLLHELHVHQEELTAQNIQLIETQNALEETRDRYVDLYDFAPIGYMTITASGVIREINLTGALLLDRERGNIIGLPFSAFVVAQDKPKFSEHLRQCRQADHGDATVELALKGRNPSPVVQLVSRRHAGEMEGKPHFVTAVIDVTERKRLEQERRSAEEARDKLTRDREIARARADAKDHFLATLSHELRTPLTPIVATMSNQQLMSMAPEPLLAALQTVRRNLDLEVRLIDDLLDVTRISRNRLVLATERVNLHEVLQDVMHMLDFEIQSHGLEMTAAFDASSPWIVGDPTRLRQVFWNLLGNAIKFTDPGGRIMITSSDGPAGFVQVSVSDTGSGMDDSVTAAINANDDETRHIPIQSASGLGLGLAICRGVVTAHGGTIDARSRGKGSGSTFVVQLPIALGRQDSASRSSERPRARPARPKRILLVEDHPDSAETLSQLLTIHDFDVTVVNTVESAVAKSEEGFDLLISDIRLPDGTGIELMRRLRSNGPIRGIAISGFGTEQDQQRSRAAGYEAHLTKPVDIDRLLSAIEHPPRPSDRLYSDG